MPEGGLDLDALVAIDVPVHVEADAHGHLSLDDELLADAARYFKGDPYRPTVPQIAEDYRAQSMAAVVFHTGQTGIGAGLPGGRGIKLRYSHPMLRDDVAADFPEFTVITAHPRCGAGRPDPVG